MPGAIASIGAGNEWGRLTKGLAPLIVSLHNKALIGHIDTVQASAEDDASVLSKRLTLTLGAYVEGKFKQWDVELKDVHQTFAKNIKRYAVVQIDARRIT